MSRTPKSPRLLAADDPQKACDDLLALTLQRGASDNVSLIIVVCDADQRTVRSDGAWLKAAAARSEAKGE